MMVEEKAVTHSKSKKESPDLLLVVMAIALGLLLIFSGVQAMELASLKERVDTELENLTLASNASAGNTLQNNIQNLPGMVGGC